MPWSWKLLKLQDEPTTHPLYCYLKWSEEGRDDVVPTGSYFLTLPPLKC